MPTGNRGSTKPGGRERLKWLSKIRNSQKGGSNMKKRTTMIAIVCLSSIFAASSWAETMKTRIGELQFTSGYPTEKTVQKIYDELDFQRAVQAYLWALPMASYGAMADEHIRLGYDNETRSMIQNEQGRPLVGSVHGAKPNDDGSYDVYFGPELPEGVPEENWVQTKPGMGWFLYLRLYGPEKPYFEKTWIPGDAEKMK
ncbi:MAG: DUF1214 domain-containing protein [Candidatus Hydrogenedentota bacterium]|nr:MAG: DUF1214 domain-containing protein [Candidatus Hydrogenedentota bacterium]